MFHDLLFNGYRLDHRSASKFDAAHANYKATITAGYYELAAPTGSLTYANQHQTSRTGTEYQLMSLPKANTTSVRHYLFDRNSKLRTGIQVDSNFFYAARSLSRGGRLETLILCVQYAAPWMRTALAEVGTREAPGTAANKQILEYFKAANFSTTDDT